MATEQLEKKLFALPGGEEFKAAVDGLSVDEITTRIANLQKALDESEEHKAANEELQAARDEVKLISGPYNDVKTAIRIKTKYLIDLSKEKGGV